MLVPSRIRSSAFFPRYHRADWWFGRGPLADVFSHEVEVVLHKAHDEKVTVVVALKRRVLKKLSGEYLYLNGKISI